MSEVEDPTEQKRSAYYRAKREYSEALRVRSETERLNPGLVKGERAKASLGERLKKNTDDLIEAKHAYELSQSMFGNGGSETRSETRTIDPQQILDRKARIAAQLIGLNYPPAIVKSYTEAIGPFLDSSAFASDPFAQRFMIERFQQGQAPTKDSIIDAVRLGAEMKASQPQNDIASVITALGSFASAFKGSGGDPAAQFQSGMLAMQPIWEKMNQSQQSMTKELLEVYKEKSQNQDPFNYLESVKQAAEAFGWKNKPETENVTLKRLELAERQWEKQTEIDADARKSKNQNDLIKTIGGNLQRVFENPVVSELGKNVGRKIPGVSTVMDARTNAAQEEVKKAEDPTTVPYGFQCAKCKVNHKFTAMQLTKIAEAGGKWVSSTPNCNEVYELRSGGQVGAS